MAHCLSIPVDIFMRGTLCAMEWNCLERSVVLFCTGVQSECSYVGQVLVDSVCLCDGCNSESNCITIVSVFHLSANAFFRTHTLIQHIVSVATAAAAIFNEYGEYCRFSASFFPIWLYCGLLCIVSCLIIFNWKPWAYTLQMDAHRIVAFYGTKRADNNNRIQTNTARGNKSDLEPETEKNVNFDGQIDGFRFISRLFSFVRYEIDCIVVHCIWMGPTPKWTELNGQKREKVRVWTIQEQRRAERSRNLFDEIQYSIDTMWSDIRHPSRYIL